VRRPLVKYGVVAAAILAVTATIFLIYANRPISIRAASIEHTVLVCVFGLGTVEARVLSKIGFEVGATLVELNVDHGDLVKKGQVLARLSTGEQEAKVAKARAAQLIAEVNIKKTEANLEGVDARTLVDQAFMETVIWLHRAGEGAAVGGGLRLRDRCCFSRLSSDHIHAFKRPTE
jgi:HlyD family secretion protein